jgi:tetratricopeptide (TPR) repeat protein
VALTLIVLVAGGVGFWSYLHARNTEVAIDSIAVLPFQNRSTEADSEYLADGLAESLIYPPFAVTQLESQPNQLSLPLKRPRNRSSQSGKRAGCERGLVGLNNPARRQSDVEMDPGFMLAHHRLAYCYERKGRHQLAIAEYQKISNTGNPIAVAGLGQAQAMAGNRSEALKALARLQELSKEKYVAPSWFALIYTAVGDKDQAFA